MGSDDHCLLPATGFYEWHQRSNGRKQPFFIQLTDQDLFYFAGLWDSSRRQDGTGVVSCALITVEGNELMRSVHNAGAHPFRMPAILAPQDRCAWLEAPREEARALLKPYPTSLMRAYPVSARVSDPRADDPALITPLPPVARSSAAPEDRPPRPASRY